MADKKKLTVTPQSSPAEVEQYIVHNYASSSWMLANPELRSVLNKLALDGVTDPAEVNARLDATNYAKTHGPASRSFDRRLALDPTGAAEEIDDAKRKLRNALRPNGIAVDDGELGELAKRSIRESWDDDDINDYVLERVRTVGGQADGAPAPSTPLALSATAVAARAKDYGVPLSPKDAQTWAFDMAQGVQTEASLTAWLVDKARDRWGHSKQMLDALDRGLTPSRMFASHRQIIGEVLEQDPETIDLFGDPTWQPILDFYDPETKERRPMTWNEARLYALKDDRVLGTGWYGKQDASFARGLLQWANAIPGAAA